jgi:hypothetical protein
MDHGRTGLNCLELANNLKRLACMNRKRCSALHILFADPASSTIHPGLDCTPIETVLPKAGGASVRDRLLDSIAV